MIRILSPRQKVPKDLYPVKIIDFPELSPSYSKRCIMGRGFESYCVHNAWVASHVCKTHLDEKGQPTQEYWDWAREVMVSQNAIKLPKDVVYYLWNGQKCGVIEARKLIFIPLYIRSVDDTEDMARLRDIYREHQNIAIITNGAYDHIRLKMSLTETVFYTKKPLSHVFVLAALLQSDPMLSLIP